MSARWMRRLVVVALAAVVTLAGWLHNQRDEHPPAHPRIATGTIGDDVRAYPLVVHVSEVVAAPLVVPEDDWDDVGPLDSGGLWVAITLSYAGIDAPVWPRGYELRDAQGRTFRQSDRVDVDTRTAQPDEFFRTDIVFEVPAVALDGDLVLRVLPANEADVPMWIAEVDLGRVEASDGATIEITDGTFLPTGER